MFPFTLPFLFAHSFPFFFITSLLKKLLSSAYNLGIFIHHLVFFILYFNRSLFFHSYSLTLCNSENIFFLNNLYFRIIVKSFTSPSLHNTTFSDSVFSSDNISVFYLLPKFQLFCIIYFLYNLTISFVFFISQVTGNLN